MVITGYHPWDISYSVTFNMENIMDLYLNNTQQVVYNSVRRSRTRGITNSVIAERTGRAPDSTRPRLTELVNEGLIAFTGDFRENDRGYLEKVYVAV